jgi:hypothetical protein
MMVLSYAGDGGVTVTYTVGSPNAVPVTSVPTAVADPPPVTHSPLPYTGAPVALELVGSIGLLVVGVLAVAAARRRRRAPAAG